MSNNRAFRDYATRVSFNMSLSRNQIYALKCVLIDIEAGGMASPQKTDLREEIRSLGFYDNYIVGARALTTMGIIAHAPGWTKETARCDALKAKNERAFWNYTGSSYVLTDAGEHVVALLRIAGLLQPAAVNTNTKKRRSA